MITFLCFACGERYEVADELAGKKIRCRKCTKPGTVPLPGAAGDEDEALAAVEDFLLEVRAEAAKAPKEQMYYFEVMGKVYGPVTFMQLQKLAALKKITQDTHISTDTDKTWVPAETVEGLFQF